jgi:hypothetical protein
VAAFLLTMVPIMPNRDYRLRVIIVPAVILAFLLATAAAKHQSLDHVLPLYAAFFLVAPASVIGQRGQVKEYFRKEVGKAPGVRNPPPRGVKTRIVVSLTVLGACAIWITRA